MNTDIYVQMYKIGVNLTQHSITVCHPVITYVILTYW